MKKSKIIIPALGVLVLSTAASITGTVAWFTANRTGTVTSGEFAVVNTNDNLAITLAAGVGTSGVDSASNPKTVTIGSGVKLTDASFDHTDLTASKEITVVTPNTNKTKVAKLTNIANLTAANKTTGETELSRGTNVYSALSWDMTFSVSFASSATKNIGLFLDLSNSVEDQTWAHEVHYFKAGEEIVADTWYSNKELSGDKLAAKASAVGNEVGYKAAPDASGKGFRIAFVPTAFATTTGGTASGLAITKVWAPHDGSADGSGKFVDGVAVGGTIAATAYGTATTSYNGTAYAAATAGSGKVLMESNTGIPEDNTNTHTYFLANNDNYLGYFGVNAGYTTSITFTCVAWYDGTHPNVETGQELETMVTSMRFGLSDLTGI